MTASDLATQEQAFFSFSRGLKGDCPHVKTTRGTSCSPEELYCFHVVIHELK